MPERLIAVTLAVYVPEVIPSIVQLVDVVVQFQPVSFPELSIILAT